LREADLRPDLREADLRPDLREADLRDDLDLRDLGLEADLRDLGLEADLVLRRVLRMRDLETDLRRGLRAFLTAATAAAWARTVAQPGARGVSEVFFLKRPLELRGRHLATFLANDLRIEAEARFLEERGDDFLEDRLFDLECRMVCIVFKSWIIYFL